MKFNKIGLMLETNDVDSTARLMWATSTDKHGRVSSPRRCIVLGENNTHWLLAFVYDYHEEHSVILHASRKDYALYKTKDNARCLVDGLTGEVDD